MEPVTSAEGKKGFYDPSVGFISIDDMEKVTNPEGQKGYYHANTGFVPAPQAETKKPATPAPATSMPWRDVGIGALKNLPGSSIDFLKNTAAPFLHPSNTVDALRDIIFGGLGKVIPGVDVDDQQTKFDAFKNALIDRYGGAENLKRTLATDPAGSLADVPALFTGGGSLAGRAPGMIGKLGEMANVAGRTMEPLGLMGKAAKAVTYPFRETAKGVLGFSTGQGKGTINQLIEGAGSPNITDYMRGKKSGENLIDEANSAVGQIKQERAADYQTRLADIEKNQPMRASIDPQTGMPSYRVAPLDLAPVEAKMKQLESSYRIKRDPNLISDTNPLGLDFHGSKLAGSPAKYGDSIGGDAAAIKEIIETTTYWPDRTPTGLDLLKQRIDNFYSPNRDSKAFVVGLKNEVKNTVVNAVPEYKTMLSNYEQHTKLIEEINDTLSIGGKKGADATLRKLQTALKDNYEFRQSVVEKLDAAVGGDFMNKLAGYNMRGMTPTSFRGQSIDVGAIFGAVLGKRPEVLALAGAASPRIVGEFLNALGQGVRYFQTAKQLFPAPVRQAATQAGRYLNPEGGSEPWKDPPGLKAFGE